MPTVTAGDIVRGALNLLQVASSDVTLTADEMNDGLEALNELIDGFSSEPGAIFKVTRESFSLTAGHNPHTWGTGGDFNSTRPVQIVAASINIGTSPTVDIPLEIVSYDVYERVRVKGLTANYPQIVYFDDAWPTANVYFYPVPAGATVNFQSYKPLTEFATQSTQLSMPYGYARMLRYNLAQELAPMYQVTAGPEITALAKASLMKIKNMNHKPTMAKPDPLLIAISKPSGRYNPYSDSRN